MRALVLAAALFALVIGPAGAKGVGRASSSHAHAHYSYAGGHYAGGHGSSHKGGHYVNPATGNHYRHHPH